MKGLLKKVERVRTVLPAAAVAAAALTALQGYIPPVYEVQAPRVIARDTEGTSKADTEKTGDMEENKEEIEKETEAAKGGFGLADGVYQGTGTGFGGSITVSVQIKNGKIVEISILSADGEDVGFLNRAKGVIDKILAAQKLDVDVVSGATYSSRGILHAMKNALEGTIDTSQAAAAPNANISPAVKPAKAKEAKAYKDGIYYGEGNGFAGKIKVKVIIKKGKIASITVQKTLDGTDFMEKASAVLDKIVKKQSTNVDTVSGATYSSSGLIEAVRDALKDAGIAQKAVKKSTKKNSKKKDKKSKDSSSQGETEVPIPSKSGKFPYPDGTYYGTGEGFKGDITVALVIKSGTIISITVTNVEADDSAFVEKAKAVAASVVEKQQTEVDMVSGATFSSRGILEAVRNALEAAKKASEDSGEGTDFETEKQTEKETESQTEAAGQYLDGEYTGMTVCVPDEYEDFLEYEISVKITVQNDKIVEISDVLCSGADYDSANDGYVERAGSGTKKYPGVVSQILSKGKTEGIDAVSGATCSSKALIEACRLALESARQTEGEPQ